MSVEQRSVAVSDPSEPQTHDFLIKRPEADIDPVEKVLKLKDFIEQLPESRATFRGGDALSPSVASHSDDLFNFVGSWQLPDYYPKGDTAKGGRKWVNPNYYHTHQYSDSYVECNCGGLVTNTHLYYNTSEIGGREEHSDDCLTQWKMGAMAELAENRAEIIRNMVDMGHEYEDIANRLGIQKKSVSGILNNVGVDLSGRKEEYMERRNRTIPRLLETHSVESISRLYDKTPCTIKKVYRRMTGESTGKLN